MRVFEARACTRIPRGEDGREGGTDAGESRDVYSRQWGKGPVATRKKEMIKQVSRCALAKRGSAQLPSLPLSPSSLHYSIE